MKDKSHISQQPGPSEGQVEDWSELVPGGSAHIPVRAPDDPTKHAA